VDGWSPKGVPRSSSSFRPCAHSQTQAVDFNVRQTPWVKGEKWDLQIYRFPRHSTMIGHLYEHGRSSGALGGMWTGGVSRDALFFFPRSSSSFRPCAHSQTQAVDFNVRQTPWANIMCDLELRSVLCTLAKRNVNPRACMIRTDPRVRTHSLVMYKAHLYYTSTMIIIIHMSLNLETEQPYTPMNIMCDLELRSVLCTLAKRNVNPRACMIRTDPRYIILRP
jgi:hypothetical protein